ncbi:DegT/DnrJ/EryC1/StrS family aminotransferase [bacterium]|nr:DegT/DnrJ/EryC1/StrS family aminotransferase [bacterium]
MIPRRRTTTYPGMTRRIISAYLNGEAVAGAASAEFERRLAAIAGTRHGIVVSSGRFGLQLILRNIGLAPGAEVIVPAYTLTELPHVVRDAGYTPVLADIEAHSLNVGPEQIAKKITERTSVILLTHMTGEPGDVDGILRLAAERGLLVIEDNAHGIGVTLPDGRPLGSLGRASFVSLATRKVVNTFAGGAILTNDDALAAKIREAVASLPVTHKKLLIRVVTCSLEISSLGRIFAPMTVRLLHSPRFNKMMVGLYRAMHRRGRETEFGYANLQALLGLDQFDVLSATIARRRAVAKTIIDGLMESPDFDREYLAALRVRAFGSGAITHNFFELIVMAHNPSALAGKLLRHGVDVGTGDDVCEDLPRLYGAGGDFPNLRHALAHAVQLPIWSTMTEREARVVVARILAAAHD